ncbi:MAG: hypothetical protein ABWW70_01625, partial [Thermoproteota archaeon]
SWLLAVSGAASVEEAATAASGQVIDWGGLSWANQAARNIIESIGGTAMLAKAFAAAGAIFAAIGIMTLREPSAAASEDAVFSMGTY